ncbi:hypothetical protein Bpfe_028216 [Biomphalaria pfeifferi]|uniref:Uncharacterized protein n=1 Tax=Biomphalaria pfeifferi TaxID=112525 RepID=A0AAD8AVF2_BIOPF|nr:hypothetical protein Bpfe_028216 [Biomphalaria pfeifferi]
MIFSYSSKKEDILYTCTAFGRNDNRRDLHCSNANRDQVVIENAHIEIRDMRLIALYPAQDSFSSKPVKAVLSIYLEAKRLSGRCLAVKKKCDLWVSAVTFCHPIRIRITVLRIFTTWMARW